MTRTTAVTQGMALPQRQGSAEVCVHSIIPDRQPESRAEFMPSAPCTQRILAIRHDRKRPNLTSVVISQPPSSTARQSKTQ
jgi:hypothetical protein